MLPMLPAVLENCAEITYPISEEFSSGLLFMGMLLRIFFCCNGTILNVTVRFFFRSGGNILGIGMVFILQATISMDAVGPPPFTPSNFVMFGTCTEYL